MFHKYCMDCLYSETWNYFEYIIVITKWAGTNELNKLCLLPRQCLHKLEKIINIHNKTLL